MIFETDKIPVTPCTATARVNRVCLCNICSRKATVIIMPLLEVNNLKKVYTTRFGGAHVQALSNVSFSVEKGEYVAIMGESGSGKTTLLNILASLDKPTSGEVLLNGRSLSAIGERNFGV